MNDEKCKEIFFNRAQVETAEDIQCSNCFEQVIFHLKDTNDRDFSLGLSTVMSCLVFAIQTGNLPKLPQSWLSDVDFVCGTSFADDENNYYSDYNFPRKRD